MVNRANGARASVNRANVVGVGEGGHVNRIKGEGLGRKKKG